MKQQRHGRSPTARPRASGGPSRSPAPWLLRHKVALPDPVAGYVERPELEQRCSPLTRRLTVLQAPGGFGKTALLAECCRRLQADGVCVSWLALDEEDGPTAVATYLALAFEQAGLQAFNHPEESAPPSVRNPAPDTQAAYRVHMLIDAIERHGRPCVLVLDELERLRSPGAVATLNILLRGAPSNLRLAIALRERPPELDIAMSLLEGHGVTVTAEELRFSTPEIARFFDTTLSRRELAALSGKSAGWPLALRIYRNAMQAGTSTSDAVAAQSETIAAWIESRLWRGISSADRDFVLDMALFDWIDATLIDEATGTHQSRLRIDSMVSLNGLLQTTGGNASTVRLHPLIRDYCVTRRFREDPQRFRTIHAGIARALARRGYLVDALRHAADAGDPALIGEIALQGGGVKLWIERGLDELRAVDRWLTADVLSAFPRLAMVRCAMLAMSGDMAGARSIYRATTAPIPSVPTSAVDRPDALELDRMVVVGILAVTGCSPIEEYRPLVTVGVAAARDPDLDPIVRGMIKVGLAIVHDEMSDFDTAAAWADTALADLGHDTLYLSPHIDYHLGAAAMAQGQTTEAAARYERALQVGRASHLGDASTVLIGDILNAELRLERTAARPTIRPPISSPPLLAECGVWHGIYAASTEVATELALLDAGVDAALGIVDATRAFAHRTERTALACYLSALRVSLLADAGRVDEAARTWDSDGLPADPAACLDPRQHRWRELEALASARLRLLIASGEFERARELATGFRQLAAERTLLRTLMRALALSIRLEWRAGDPGGAVRHLAEFLGRFSAVDYARPLARERDIVLPLLADAANLGLAEPALCTGTALHAAMTTAPGPASVPEPCLTERELEVLRCLPSLADKEIARELNLSYEGVRYRLRRIFEKLGARGRHDAVHRARDSGILPPESPRSPSA